MSEQQDFPGPIYETQQLAEDIVIPISEEQLVVSKQVIETGTVRLRKYTEERIETIDVPLIRVQWQVNRVAINQVVSEQPAVRQDGETTVYPVVEERVTVLRELVLVEEVHVTRRAITTVEKSTHTLLREKISEERLPAGLTGS